MTKYGPEKFKGRKTLPIKQLVALGKSLCDKKDEIGTLPSDVDYYFKEVIRERAYLSQHFRDFRDACEKDDIDTINHEHFTDSLKQIHAILLTVGKPVVRSKTSVTKTSQKQSRSSTNSSSGVSNSFSHLLLASSHDQLDLDGSDDGALSETETNATSECAHSTTENYVCPCEADEDEADFLDIEGRMGGAVETSIFLKVILMLFYRDAVLIRMQNVVKISEAVKVCWAKAGKGDMPIAAAAAYTNVLIGKALGCVRNFCQVDPDHLDSVDPKKKLESVCSGIRSASIDQGLDELALTLCHIHDKILSQSFQTMVPAEQTGPFTLKHVGDPLTLTNALILDLQHAYEFRTCSAINFDGIPFSAELFPPLQRHNSEPTTFISSVIIYLMSVSHCAYSSTLARPSSIAMPRINALKMANEALAIIRNFIDDKSIFPCQCINTLGYRVAQMGRDLEAFARYKCWNAASQCPLVAGNHLLEIHDLCSYYGMHLFHYRQYVAGVLHTYQALVKLDATEKIQVLEDVCDLFAPVLYTTGTRPESGFLASWLRYIGARLKFKKGKKDLNHKDTWCMSVPAHAAAKSAGLNINQRNDETKIQPKFDYGTIDQIIKLKRDGWVLQRDASETLEADLQIGCIDDLEQNASLQSHQAPLGLQKTKRTKHARTKSCHINKEGTEAAENSCSKLDHTFISSFTAEPSQRGRLPPSRFNLLSFFYSMTKMVSAISDSTHAEDNVNETSNKNNGRGQMCLCFVQTILRGADRILDVRKRCGIDAKGAVWGKNEKECIECYKEFLMKTLDEAKVLDSNGGQWLWSSL